MRGPDLEAGGVEQVAETVATLDDAYVLGGDHRSIVLIRHGEQAPASSDERYDPGLSERGERQVGALARRLDASVSRDAVIVHSPRRRTRETARILGDRLDLELYEEPGLAEVGGFHAPVPVPVVREPGRVPQFVWREPHGPFREPAREGVEAAIARTDAPVVLAVTHGGVVNAYVADLLGLEGEFFVYPRHTSMTVVRVDGARVALDRLNDAAHLEGEDDR